MGKTYIETIKYLIVADFQVKGLVERPDVIGAVFGQSEGLLGSELDIKELQQNGKIGRIEIEYNHSNNTTTGILKLPCSVSMVETAIVAASIETIEKVGPCDAYFTIKEIEDTRELKRKQLKNRAIDLLGRLMQEQIPDTRELMDEIVETFKIKDISTIGSEKLVAGPTAKTSKEIIIVEGRADVLNLLKYGITNAIATGGARIPRTLADLCRNKAVTLFLDGDHGGDIQQYQLMRAIKIEYVARAPDGKEVEELTQKEVNQALRRKIKASNINARSGRIKPESIIKQTKFSTTHEHKIAPKIFQETKEKTGKTYFKTSGPEKQPDSFDSMLAEIPNLERVDVDKTQDNRSSDYSRPRTEPFSKPNYKKPQSIKEKIDQTIADMRNKEQLKNTENISEKQETPNQEKTTTILDKKEPAKQETPKPEKNTTIEYKKEPVKEIQPKEEKKELPKLTEDLKKGFLKIIEEINDKKESRILNEKLRRIGSCKNTTLERKLKNFKKDKAFAVVTSKELTDNLKKIAIEKGIFFIVAKETKEKSKDINVLNYEEIKK